MPLTCHRLTLYEVAATLYGQGSGLEGEHYHAMRFESCRSEQRIWVVSIATSFKGENESKQMGVGIFVEVDLGRRGGMTCSLQLEACSS